MKLQGIEAGRGIAAALVLLRHASVIVAGPHGGVLPFGGLFLFGRAGVEFFFVLSGFILTFVHLGDIGVPEAAPRFWRKRLLRIYPTYWVATLLLGAVLVVSPTHDRAEQEPVHMLLSLALLPEARMPILDVGWSLRHEMLFYLLFSVAVLNRRAGQAVLGAWLAGIVGQMACLAATGLPLVAGTLPELVLAPFNLEFFLGIGVALLVRRGLGGGWPLLAAGVGVFVGNGMAESFAGELPGVWYGVLIYGAGAALMLYGAARLDLAGGWRVPRALVALGTASYSIYLTHVLVVMIVEQALKRAPWVPGEVGLAVVVGVALVAGVAFSRVVEQPLLHAWRGRARLA